MQKIGLFFGTFDPIHNGHLTLANHFANETDLDAVWLVITPQNPFKQNSKILSNKNRLELVSLAIKSNPKLQVSSIEFDLPTPNYTIQTLKKIKAYYPKDNFVLILGEDNLSSFDKWKDYSNILSDYELYVYPRRNNEAIPKNLQEHPKIKRSNAPQIEISSSEIRKRIQKGEDVSKFIPKLSWSYLKKKKFYRF